MKIFNGNVLFLDRSDINTDEIIPAKYLTEISREALAPYLLEDLNLEEFDPAADIKGKGVIVTRGNFGCGSSREHAPWALEVNGINIVVGESFARIFRQNMFNCGMMAVELPTRCHRRVCSPPSPAAIHRGRDRYRCRHPYLYARGRRRRTVSFDIVSKFDSDLVAAGGWVEFADANY